MKIFSGECSTDLANKVAKHLNQELGECELSRFPNGENRVWLKEKCENETVIIFQNFSSPVDQNIMQFCLMVDAARRMNPASIVGVIPWLGYAKQDKVFREGEPLAAEVVAKIVSSLKLDKLYLLDVHHPSIKSFFSMPTEELSSADIFVDSIKNGSLAMKQWNNATMDSWCVCAPDIGSLSRNKYISEKLKLPLFQIEKKRDLETGKVQIKGINHIKSDSLRTTDYVLRTSSVLMFDDMILSGGTVVKDAQFLKSQGVNEIYFFATHLDPTDETFENLGKAPVKKIIVTDSLPFSIPDDIKHKFTVVSVSSLFHQILSK
jgi:ribose-phosphate pyrophosphokinase